MPMKNNDLEQDLSKKVEYLEDQCDSLYTRYRFLERQVGTLIKELRKLFKDMNI